MSGTSAARHAKLSRIELAWDPVHNAATRLRISRDAITAAFKAHKNQFGIGFDPRQRDRDFLLDSALRGIEAVRYGTKQLANERMYGVGAVSKTWRDVVSTVVELRQEYHVFFQAFAAHRQSLHQAVDEVLLERRFERNVCNTRDADLKDIGERQIEDDQKAVLDAIRRDSHGLEFSMTKLKADREMVTTIIQDSCDSMDKIKEELRDDRAIVQETVQRFVSVGWDAVSKPTEDLTATLPRTWVTLSSSVERLFNNSDLIHELHKWDELDDIAEHRCQEQPYMLAAVKVTGRAYEFAPEALKENYEIAFEAVKQHWQAIRFAPDRFLKDGDLVIEGVKQDGRAYEYADSWLREDRSFALRCMTENGRALEFASKKLRADFSIVMEAVQTYPRAIAWGSSELRCNKVIAQEAVSRDWRALGLASKSFRKDRKLALAAVQQNWRAVEFLDPELLDKGEIGFEAVRQSWRAMHFLGPTLRGSYNLAVVACKQDLRALSFFTKEVRKKPGLYLETGLAKAMQ